MKIEFKDTGISTLIKNYLAEKEELRSFYHRFPHKENYQKQAEEKLAHYEHRETLHNAITKQMAEVNLHDKQKENLKLLKNPKTVTVTTGHQLNLITGPLYFIYKIIHTIRICDDLNSNSHDIHYVPIYWMATEDHDFEEINHFNTYKKTYQYDAPSGGFVGDIASFSAKETLNTFFEDLPDNKFSEDLKSIISKAYKETNDLSQATRILVNELLGKYGILILDGNDKALKELMIPYFKKELTTSRTQDIIEDTNVQLSAYKNQAYAREINLFYLHNNQRERIEKVKDKFILVDSNTTFTEDSFIEILRNHPERFSPNVILRPLYQEVILPNVAYVGGGGEIAYWLQLKAMFSAYHITFPMLVLRNSMLILPNAMKHKASSLDLISAKMFKPKFELKREIVEANSNLFKQVEILKQRLAKNFDALEEIAKQTGDDFAQMVRAQKKKQMNGYDKLNHRLNLSEQKQQDAIIKKLEETYDYMFPQGNWQERYINFSEFYKYNGSDLFAKIYSAISPFNSRYHVITLDSILK
ncbi:MAG: bacillithiol biosynthesis cysteine-adding enzyme BshC [Weeksellaceae bacterium]